MKRRVVITGLGVIAPNGIGRDQFWNALIEGRSGIGKITSFDASDMPCQIAGEVTEFRPTDDILPKLARRLPRVSQFGMVTAKMAATDARLEEIPAQRLGVAFGTSLGKEDIFEEDYHRFLRRAKVKPFIGEKLTPHFSTSYIAIELAANGPAGSFSSGCTTVPVAIDWACAQIQNGYVDAVMVASAESLLWPFPFAALCATGGFLSFSQRPPEQVSRPFELHRNGAVLSEGGGAIVLEAREHAINRKAPVYAELRGYAISCEGRKIRGFDMSGEPLAKTMMVAVDRSLLHRSEIDYICAHGVSTPNHDWAETRAIKLAFDRRGYSIPVSSIKSMIGHSFAASATFQIIASCLGLRNQMIPPTINYETPDPECDLDYVPNQARIARLRNVLINVEGFGGIHSTLVLGMSLE